MAKGSKTGGRTKGTPNKATAAKAAEIEATGETPLDYMLRIMRDAAQDFEVRLDAAKSAAPYVHPKLAAIEHSGPNGTPIEITEVSRKERLRRIAFALRQGLQTVKSQDPVS